MFGLGAAEILIILVFALMFIGPKKLPELAKSLGKGLREFQRAKDDLMYHVDTDLKDDEEIKSPDVVAAIEEKKEEALNEEIDSVAKKDKKVEEDPHS